MLSTGVYWIPLYEILEQCRFVVYLANARHTRRIYLGARATYKRANGC